MYGPYLGPDSNEQTGKKNYDTNKVIWISIWIFDIKELLLTVFNYFYGNGIPYIL